MRMNEAAGRQDDSGEQVRAYLQWFLQENVAQLQAIICGYVGSQSKSVQDPSHSEPLIEHWDGRRWRVDIGALAGFWAGLVAAFVGVLVYIVLIIASYGNTDMRRVVVR